MTEKTFVVLTVFDFASCVERKNPWASLLAFVTAFCHGDEDVILIIKTINGDHFKDEFQMVKDMTRRTSNRIFCLDDCVNREIMSDLYLSCDAYISLHRAEGFGLTILEAMMAEKPVVVTGYSGNMGFTNDTNSCLVSYRLVPVTSSKVYSGGNWAEPDRLHGAFHLYRLYKNHNLRSSIGRKAKEYVDKLFRIEDIGKRLVSVIASARQKR